MHLIPVCIFKIKQAGLREDFVDHLFRMSNELAVKQLGRF